MLTCRRRSKLCQEVNKNSVLYIRRGIYHKLYLWVGMSGGGGEGRRRPTKAMWEGVEI